MTGIKTQEIQDGGELRKAESLGSTISVICCLQETHIIDTNKHCYEVIGWKIYQANCSQHRLE
jgi:hypothetical protein